MTDNIQNLNTLTNDSTLVNNVDTIDAQEHNTHRSNYRDQINLHKSVLEDHDKNYASSTAPSLKSEGKVWCDTTNDPAVLKYYKDGSANDEELVGTTLTQTVSNKTLNSITLESTSIITPSGTSFSQQLVPTIIGGIIAYSATNYRDSNGDIQTLSYDTTSLIDGHFMVCTGFGISRTTYSELFARIGTTYGVGDGVNTFSLPTLNEGSFLRGLDHPVSGDTNVIGQPQDHQLQQHTHGYLTADNLGVNGGSGNIRVLGPVAQTTGVTGANFGAETRPRNHAVFWLIRVI
jgi:hypothetical protein